MNPPTGLLKIWLTPLTDAEETAPVAPIDAEAPMPRPPLDVIELALLLTRLPFVVV